MYERTMRDKEEQKVQIRGGTHYTSSSPNKGELEETKLQGKENQQSTSMFGMRRSHKSTENNYYSDSEEDYDKNQDYVRQFGQGKLSDRLNQ